MDFAELIDTYLAHIIGVIALVQVWIIAAWNKWGVKPRIQFHPTANVEIGFSAFGSTVSLPGAVRVLNKRVFVSEMRLKVVREKDASIHDFTWRAFKSSKLTGPSLAPENIEFASAFTVAPGLPRSLNIFFASENFSERHAARAMSIQAAWTAFLQARQPAYGQQFAGMLNDPAFVDQLFSEFRTQNNTVKEFYSELNSGFFWSSGEYSMELRISSAQLPDKIYRWSLLLNEEEEQRLRSNIDHTIKECCKVYVAYDFVYKQYKNKI